MSEAEDPNRPHTNMSDWLQHHVINQASRRCLKQLVGGSMRRLHESDRPALNNCVQRVVLCSGIGMKLMQDDKDDQ